MRYKAGGGVPREAGPMKILAVDIGAGTRDILFYDSSKRLENCIKMVLPSPGPLYANRVAEETARSSDLLLEGCVVGGGPLTRAVKRHVQSGLRVYAEREAAFCLRNNLEDVLEMGVELVEGRPEGFRGAVLRLDELDLQPLESLLLSVGESLQEVDAAAVAVQDHGTYGKGQSNRKTRMEWMRATLLEDPRPSRLAYTVSTLPPRFPRMRSALERLRQQLSCEALLVMDTAPAAVIGCMADPMVQERASGNLLLVNAGNGHTMACLLGGGRVLGLLEHHTARLEPSSFGSYLEAFCSGKAADEDDFMRDGHGLFYLDEPPGMRNIDMVAVTGPNREMMLKSGLEVYFPSPGGDMMMTGPMGLVSSVLEKEREWQ